MPLLSFDLVYMLVGLTGLGADCTSQAGETYQMESPDEHLVLHSLDHGRCRDQCAKFDAESEVRKWRWCERGSRSRSAVRGGHSHSSAILIRSLEALFCCTFTLPCHLGLRCPSVAMVSLGVACALRVDSECRGRKAEWYALFDQDE